MSVLDVFCMERGMNGSIVLCERVREAMLLTLARTTASRTGRPRAMPAAMALESVQPVPWVWLLSTRLPHNHQPSAAHRESEACDNERLGDSGAKHSKQTNNGGAERNVRRFDAEEYRQRQAVSGMCGEQKHGKDTAHRFGDVKS